MAIAKPNSNWTSLSGKSVHEKENLKYQEYREQWMAFPKKFIVRDFPVHLDIEITNRCNIRCTFCDKLPLLSDDQIGDMEIDLFKKIIDEGAEHDLWGVKLSYRGEPLLHSEIIEMVYYAKKKGVLDVFFNTNGMLLNEKMSRSLIDAGLDRISISVDGIDPERFEKERRGASFKKIMNNIDELMELKEKFGNDHPRVIVQTVRLPGIDLEEYSAFWQPHCDQVGAADYKDVVNRTVNLIKSDWACPQLWQRMTIEFNGAIMPCNNDDYRLLSPGNVKFKSVKGSWHSENVNEARRLHQKGHSHKVKACDGCPWRTSQIMKTEEYHISE